MAKSALKKTNGSLSKTAYKKILDALFSKKIASGAFFSQKELSDLLKVPTQPLRDALGILQVEGLVVVHPRAGVEFLTADFALARSTYQFRGIIERAAARRFAESGDPRDFESLIAKHNSLLDIMERDGMDAKLALQYEKLDHEFHDIMVSSLKNEFVETTSRRLQKYIALLFLDETLSEPIAKKTLREHLAILDACVHREPERAEEALSAHLQSALNRLMKIR